MDGVGWGTYQHGREGASHETTAYPSGIGPRRFSTTLLCVSFHLPVDGSMYSAYPEAFTLVRNPSAIWMHGVHDMTAGQHAMTGIWH